MAEPQYMDLPPGTTKVLPPTDPAAGAASSSYMDLPPGTVSVEQPTNSGYGKSLQADMNVSNPTTPTTPGAGYDPSKTGDPFEEVKGGIKEAWDMGTGLVQSVGKMAVAPFYEGARILSGDLPKDKTDAFNRLVASTPVGAMLKPNADLATKMLVHARESKAAGTQDDWSTKLRGAQLGTESLIPFAGPMAESIYEREMASGSPAESRQNVGRGTTDAAALLTGTEEGGALAADMGKQVGKAAVGKVKAGIAKVKAPFAADMAKLPPVNPGEVLTPSEVKAAAQASPGNPAVPLTAAQILRNPTLTRAEAISERSIGGDSVLSKQKAAARTALATRGEKAITDLGGGKPYRGATDVGQQTSVKASIQSDLAKADAKAALDNFEQKMSPVKIETDSVRDWAGGQASKFGELFKNEMAKYSGPAKRVVQTLQQLGEKANPAAAPPEIMSQLQGLPKAAQDKILTEHGFTPDAPDVIHEPLKWDTVRGLKSDFYDLANDPNATPRAQGLAKQATAELEDLLQGAVKERHGSKGVAQYRAANQKWADWQDQFNDPSRAIKQVIDAKYGKNATSQLVGGQGNPQIIRELQAAKVDLGPIKQQVASRIMNNKWKLGGDGTFGGYKGDFLTTLFTPDELKGLQTIGQMSRSLSPSTELRVNNMGKMARGAFRNPIAAKLFTSKWFTEWMTRENPAAGAAATPPPGPGVKTAPPAPNAGGPSASPAAPRPTANMTSGAGGSNYTAADLAALKAKHKIPPAPGNVVGAASLLDDIAAAGGGGKVKDKDLRPRSLGAAAKRDIPPNVREAFEKFVDYDYDKPTLDGTEKYTSSARLGQSTKLSNTFRKVAKEAGLDPDEISKQILSERKGKK